MSYNSVALENRAWRRNQNTARYQTGSNRFGPISNILVVAILLSIMGLVYLTQVTKTSSYGYQIDDLNSKKTALEDENRALQIESARLQALERVKTSDVAKSLETPSNVNFVNP